MSEPGPVEVMVVAGEASGDQHAADLVAALKAQRPALKFFGMGGPMLAAQGVELVHGAHEISVMGIVEVLPKVPRIWKVLGDLSREAARRRPACAVLVDIPDFNLRLAKRLKHLGVTVAYYISPTVWAWREGRTKTIAERVDRLMCILPFEEKFLRARGVDAVYVGNPVLDQVPPVAPPEQFRAALGLDVARRTLALLPGSRRSEIRRILPTLVDVGRRLTAAHPGLQLIVPVAAGLDRALLEAHFEGSGLSPRFIDGRAPEVVGACDVAVVASGTATLEAGLMRRPLVAVYRVAPVSYLVGLVMVNVPFFCLVNLLAQKRVVPELLQDDMTAERIAAEVDALWQGPAREALLTGLDEVRALLGPAGASGRAAAEVLALLTRAETRPSPSASPPPSP